MAEAAGLIMGAISLASMFQTCIECVEYVEAGRDMSRDLETTFALLDLQKCRFLLFGDKSGILEPTSSTKRIRYLDDERYQPFIQNALNNIFLMFQDSKRLEDRYGMRDRGDGGKGGVEEDSGIKPVRRRGTDFKRNINHGVKKRYSALVQSLAEKARVEKIEVGDLESYAAGIAEKQKAASFLAKARWAVHDKGKFRDLVDVLAKMIDSLLIFISVEREVEDSILDDIRGIRDPDRLGLILVACIRAHPAISQAAGDVIEIVSKPGVSEEVLEEEIMSRAIVRAEEYWGEETDVQSVVARVAHLDVGGSTAIVARPKEEDMAMVKGGFDPSLEWRGLPSQHISRVFLVAHGCETATGSDAPTLPFITDGELRTMTDDSFQPQIGRLLGIRLAEACPPIFYHYMQPLQGFKYIYTAPTEEHLELAISIASKSSQVPQIRIDHRLLWKALDEETLTNCLEAAGDTLAERELDAYQAHGARHAGPQCAWPPLLKFLDHSYLDRISVMGIEQGSDGSSGTCWVGLRDIFAELDQQAHGDVIVVADWNMIGRLVATAPTVEFQDGVLRKQSVTRLVRVSNKPDSPMDVQFWKGEFFATVGRR